MIFSSFFGIFFFFFIFRSILFYFSSFLCQPTLSLLRKSFSATLDTATNFFFPFCFFGFFFILSHICCHFFRIRIFASFLFLEFHSYKKRDPISAISDCLSVCHNSVAHTDCTDSDLKFTIYI